MSVFRTDRRQVTITPPPKDMADGDSLLPRIQSVFYAEFDNDQGPKIVYQVPEGLIAVPTDVSFSQHLQPPLTVTTGSSSPRKRLSTANTVLFHFDEISKYGAFLATSTLLTLNDCQLVASDPTEPSLLQTGNLSNPRLSSYWFPRRVTWKLQQELPAIQCLLRV